MAGRSSSNSWGGISVAGPEPVCTMIAEKIAIEGSGKGAHGWFTLGQAYVSYDHPYNLDVEHALNLDFVNEAQGVGARVAVELTPAAARRLAEGILAALDRAGE